MRIEQDIKLDYKDVLFKPKRSKLESRRNVDLNREFKFHNSGQTWTGVPIMASNMDGVGTFSMAKALQEQNMITVMRKHYTVDDWQKNAKGLKLKNVSVCTGTGVIWDPDAPDFATMKAVLAMYPDIPFITVDVANAYHENYGDFIAKLRDEYPDKTIIAGNVITGEMTEELIIRGADIIKCGIGPGSVCTTRLQTGVGVPQLSGIIECADAANGIGGHIIADGGCVYAGDVAKAFGAGAHFVMLGGMLAGYDESEGDVVDGKIQFYGMSSDAAMSKHGSRKDGYRGAEGKVVQLPHRGPVAPQLVEILGGVRSACTYIGARRIKDMPKCTTFVRCTQQVNQVFNAFG
ncbi:MAG: GMP reductase [Verrucomicrobiales bacterium]|nr:GMP reductase [Verrucomicrobiales bacterium]|tara:strand:+ start:1318 stop:2361 length:1044 start_codon:yes stop_codon:yes gene_type:complete